MIAEIHEPMPVNLEPEHFAVWFILGSKNPIVYGTSRRLKNSSLGYMPCLAIYVNQETMAISVLSGYRADIDSRVERAAVYVQTTILGWPRCKIYLMVFSVVHWRSIKNLSPFFVLLLTAFLSDLIRKW